MTEFVLYTHGTVSKVGPNGEDFTPVRWSDLNAFTQGYIEALFFTQGGPEEGELGDAGFSDLAPEVLASIVKDCALFQQSREWLAWDGVPSYPDSEHPDDAQAGRDLWYTRQGHGCGFWDGDWPEPYASDLTKRAKAMGEVSPYLGDDGLIYL